MHAIAFLKDLSLISSNLRTEHLTALGEFGAWNLAFQQLHCWFVSRAGVALREQVIGNLSGPFLWESETCCILLLKPSKVNESMPDPALHTASRSPWWPACLHCFGTEIGQLDSTNFSAKFYINLNGSGPRPENVLLCLRSISDKFYFYIMSLSQLNLHMQSLPWYSRNGLAAFSQRLSSTSEHGICDNMIYVSVYVYM